MKLPNIIDNQRKIFLDTFLQVAPDHKYLSVATGYWDIEGMRLVIESIKDFEKVRILIGREPLLKRDNKSGIELPEPDYPDQDFFDDLQRISPSPELKQVVIKMKELINSGQLEVKVYRRTFLHAKCYIFGDEASDNAVGIIGSSNFTRNGMTTNLELSALESDVRVVAFEPKSEKQEVGHLFWFNHMWNDELTEDWTGEFSELIGTSKHGDTLFSPRELYLRTLMEVYKSKIDAEKQEIVATKSKTLFDFQQSNVKNLTRILDEYGVAMLADSVGLGKTISAIGVIKQYPNQRVVVVAPKTLVGHWETELAEEGIHNARVISLQNKNEMQNQMDVDRFAPVGLFVIDESHNLRSHNSVRYELLADWIASEYNESSRVLLATATPINNSLTDLTNQILLGARGDQDIFTIAVKSSYDDKIVNRSFYEAIDNIRKRIQQNIAQGKEDLTEIYEEARMTIDPIIRNFVVRNTRQSIKEIKLPDGTIEKFPEVKIKNTKYPQPRDLFDISDAYEATSLLPVELLAETMDTLLHPLRQLGRFSDHEATPPASPSSTYKLYQLILSLSFVPYRWRMYDFQYYGKSKDDIRSMNIVATEKRRLNMQLSLYGIMRTLFLKRLESSVSAIEVSMGRYKERLQIFERALVERNIIINLSDIDDILDEYDVDDGEQKEFNEAELREKSEVKAQEVSDNYKVAELKEDIAAEIALIDEILAHLSILKENDSKIVILKNRLLKDYQENPQQKILIFSFFADTIQYINDSISTDDRFQSILPVTEFVSGRDRMSAIKSAKRFAPVAQKASTEDVEEGELTYLFATDVLSEGQNLQDAGRLINYDLHWNPVRMIQRNGRINRLGSTFTEVEVENFIPGEDLESFLNLMKKINQKIDLIKHTIGNDSSIFGEDTDGRSYTGIYSENTEEANEEYGKLESELDAFADDLFYSDLVKFLETATEKEIRIIERITPGTWTLHKENLSTPDDVITLSKFKFEEGKSKDVFFGNSAEADSIEVIPSVLALKKIRTEDNERKLDTVSVNRTTHESVLKEYGPQISRDVYDDGSLTPTKEKVLGASNEYGWKAEEKDKLRATLTTRNVILARKVARLVKSINSNLNSNVPSEVEYKKLKKLLIEPTEAPEVKSVDLMFGFTNQ